MHNISKRLSHPSAAAFGSVSFSLKISNFECSIIIANIRKRIPSSNIEWNRKLFLMCLYKHDGEKNGLQIEH